MGRRRKRPSGDTERQTESKGETSHNPHKASQPLATFEKASPRRDLQPVHPTTDEKEGQQSGAYLAQSHIPSQQQRRRWRRRQRRKAKSSAGILPPTSLGSAQIATSSTTSQEPQDNAIPDAMPASNKSGALRKRYSVTQLVQRPQKRWQDDTTTPNLVGSKATSAVLDAGPYSAKATKTVSMSSQTSNTPRMLSIPPQEQSSVSHASNRELPRLHASRFLTSNRLSRSSIRRTSFGQKPMSVPSQSENKDVAASFRQFSAFLQDRDESEESSSSSNESDDPTSHGTSSALAARIVERSPNDSLEEKGLSKDGQNTLKPSSAPDRDPTSRSSIATSWPANVGIRRHTASFDREQGVTSSAVHSFAGRRNDLVHSPSSQPQPTFSSSLSHSGASEELYKIIDEVSHNVFNTTHPLPACKPSVTSDPTRHEDHKDGLMTNPSSDLSVTEAARNTSHSGATWDVPALNGPATVCQDVTVAESHHPSTWKSTTISPVDKFTTENDEPGVLAALENISLDSPAIKERRKRKMTGVTSKHFTPEKRMTISTRSAKDEDKASEQIPDREIVDNAVLAEGEAAIPQTLTPVRKQRKGTGHKSTYFATPKPVLDPDVIDRVDFYNTTAGVRNKSVRRVPAGTSTAPVPPISDLYFGIIQEKLWREPFWLLIAVTFLNKTTGRAAVPVFWELKKRYITPEALADAPQEELEALIWHLGLQRQRSKRLVSIAQAWIAAPPKQGVRFRTLHYPSKYDGKEYKAAEPVEADADDCAGALEIGHIPGCGPYAWDSWRIFCRDVLRCVAHDYNGSEAEIQGFTPEWMRVLPGDKELRACLRWMWLREGWIWDCETGAKRRATADEIERAVHGEMDVPDMQERSFAARAAGVEVVTPMAMEEKLDEPVETPRPPCEAIASEENTSPTVSRTLRRSARLSALE